MTTRITTRLVYLVDIPESCVGVGIYGTSRRACVAAAKAARPGGKSKVIASIARDLDRALRADLDRGNVYIQHGAWAVAQVLSIHVYAVPVA